LLLLSSPFAYLKLLKAVWVLYGFLPDFFTCDILFFLGFTKLLSPVRPDWKKNGPTPAMAFLVTMGLECSFFDPIPTGCVLKSFSTISWYAATGAASGLP